MKPTTVQIDAARSKLYVRKLTRQLIEATLDVWELARSIERELGPEVEIDLEAVEIIASTVTYPIQERMIDQVFDSWILMATDQYYTLIDHQGRVFKEDILVMSGLGDVEVDLDGRLPHEAQAHFAFQKLAKEFSVVVLRKGAEVIGLAVQGTIRTDAASLAAGRSILIGA